jgi:hypothetical protein
MGRQDSGCKASSSEHINLDRNSDKEQMGSRPSEDDSVMADLEPDEYHPSKARAECPS